MGGIIWRFQIYEQLMNFIHNFPVYKPLNKLISVMPGWLSLLSLICCTFKIKIINQKNLVTNVMHEKIYVCYTLCTLIPLHLKETIFSINCRSQPERSEWDVSRG